MKQSVKRLILSVVFIAAAAGLVLVLYGQWRKPAQEKKRKRGKKGAITVEVATVKTGRIVSKGRYIGSLLPRFQFVVAPQVGGRLSQLTVRIGDRVKPKQLLATIENEELVHQVEQALAAVRVARAQLDEQNARLINAKKEYRRELALKSKGLTSASEREKKESAYKVEAAKVRVMQAQLAQKRSMLKAARVRLSYTRVYAQWVSRPLSKAKTKALMEAKETLDAPLPNNSQPPGSKKKSTDKSKKSKKSKKSADKKTPSTQEANGMTAESYRVVGERFANEGALVQPNARLLTLLDIRSVIAVIYATEKDYIELKTGQVAVARTYVYKNRTFTGRVARIAPLVKESSRLARVELEFPNLNLALKPGMFVRIEIELQSADKATLIPRQALVRHKEKDGVFALDPKQQTVRFVPVKVGIEEGDIVQVLSPPLSGQVVTMGYHLLRDGAKVTIAGSKRTGKKGNGKRSSRRQK